MKLAIESVHPMPKTTLVRPEANSQVGTSTVSCSRHSTLSSFAWDHFETWLPASQTWQFDLHSLRELKQILIKLYGSAQTTFLPLTYD